MRSSTSSVVTFLSALSLADSARAAPAPQILSSVTSAAGSEVSSITSGAGGVVSSATSAVGSVATSIASAVESALPSAILGVPSVTQVENALGIDNSTIAALPTSGLLVPSYSNFTSQGWNVRFNAFIYKLPALNESSVDKVVSLLPGIDSSSLNATEQMLLTNRTENLASVPVPNAQNITVQVVHNGQDIGSPIALQAADDFGEIDQFLTVPGLANATGNSTQLMNSTRVDLYIPGLEGPANGTTILVPEQGYSIVSDIDDVLRVTQVYVPTNGLKNSFVEPYVNYETTPEVFATWKATLPGVAFHYDTTTPLELTRTYVDYLFNNYPFGSLDMRPINLTEPSSVLDARQTSLERLFQTFPQRKFVLVGDTSSSTLLTAYPQIADQYPEQLACIFIRNTSATDSEDKLPYDTSAFQNVSNTKYFFYTHPNDLFGIDIAGGNCLNSTIPQNVTFGEQGGPFRI